MFSPAQVEQLLRPVNPRRVQRDNHGMSHLAAYDVSAHLTRIFGFGGWRKEILSLDLVAEDAVMDPERNRLGWFVTYRCTMRLHVGEWWNDDGATGSASNLPDRGDAHDFAAKNAISYALKRCAKDLGDQFGLSLYNKGSVAALVGRTLAPMATANGGVEGGPERPFVAAVDQDVPELAPDWEQPGRADGLPTNADGSLSRSRTSDAEKDAAGVMTDAQLKEHTALGGGHPKDRKTTPTERERLLRAQAGAQIVAGEFDDPWYGSPPVEGRENDPGTVSATQQRAIHAKCKGMDREARLATISDIVGRQVASSNELSYTEAARVLEKLT